VHAQRDHIAFHEPEVIPVVFGLILGVSGQPIRQRGEVEQRSPVRLVAAGAPRGARTTQRTRGITQRLDPVTNARGPWRRCLSAGSRRRQETLLAVASYTAARQARIAGDITT
jgi:hypothetical protein